VQGGGDIFLKINLPMPLKARGHSYKVEAPKTLAQLQPACARWGRRFFQKQNLLMLSKARGHEAYTTFIQP
jgi:hypothetical protein